MLVNGLPSLPQGYTSSFKHANLDSIESERKRREAEDSRAGRLKFDHMRHKPYACS